MYTKEKQILAIVTTLGLIIFFVKKKMSDEWIKPVVGKLTSGFGYRIDPVTKEKKQFHNGQDIAVPTGTPIKAPSDGIIISVAPSEQGGNQVIIKHTNGWQTGYAHLSKVLVTKGQAVKQGDTIALSGNTGKHTTAPHLHFTMTNPKGVKVDPKLMVYRA